MSRRKKVYTAIIIFLLLLSIFGVFVYRGVRNVVNQVEPYAAYWQAERERPLQTDEFVYVALGDSVAQGIGASQPAKGYVGLLAKAMEDTLKRPVHVLNLSVSGAKIQDVIDKQLPALKQRAIPENAVITLDIGSNNLRNFEPERFGREFEALLQQLPPETVVATIPYFGPDWHGHGGRQAKQVNEEIVLKFLKKHGFAVAEVYKATEGHDSLSYYASDFFHPSDKSYKNWFEAFWHVIEPRLEE